MASLSSVTIDLKVAGEAQATQALNRFYNSGEKVGTSVVGLANKISSVQGEWKKLTDLYNRQVVGIGALTSAQEKLVSNLSKLTGMTQDQARDALKLAQADAEAAAAAQRKAQADAKAAQAAQARMNAIKNLEGSVLKEGQAVNNAVNQLKQLEQLRQKGAVSAARMQQGELEIARALAATNGYLKANGALNTQKAQAEIRAAQATQQAAAADAAAAATKTRLTQSYNQLLASINPVIARQQQTRQTVDMLRAAVAAGAITTTQAAQALNQYRNALRAMDAANQLATRGMSRVGVITQQAGYQVGDFIVQIQSGTNVMVALGQQATQLIGTFAMLARTTRGIAIFSALGVAVPILTAVGAAIMRASGESENLEKKLQKLDQSADKLGATLDRLEDTELAEKFGDLTDEVLSISQAMVGLDQAAQLNNLIGVLDRVEDAASAGWFRMLDAQMAQGVENIRAFFNPFESMVGSAEVSEAENEKAFAKLGFDMARSQFLSYTEELQRLAQSGDTAGVVAEFDRFIRDATDNGAELSMSGIALAASMEKAALATAETAARLNGSAQAAKDAAEAEKQRLQFLREDESLFSAHLDAYESSLEAEKQRLQFLREEKGLFSAHVDAYKSVVEARMAGEDVYAQHVKAYQEEQAAAAEALANRQAALLEENTRFEAEQEKKRAIARAEGDAARIAAINLYYDNAEKREAELARVEAERAAIRKGESDFLRDSEAETALARRRLEILQSYNSEGEKTTQTLELEIALASELLREQELRKAATDGITQAERDAIDELVEANAQIMRAEAGLNDAADAAKGLTAELRAAVSAMSSLVNMGNSLDVQIATLEAEVNAYKQGLNVQAEGKRAGLVEKATQERDVALASGLFDPDAIDAVFQERVAQANRVGALTTEKATLAEAQREADRAANRGGTAARKDEEYLYKLEQEAIAKRALIGLSEEQKLQDERRAQITLKLAEDGRELTEREKERIEGIIKTEAETRKLMQAEQERQQLMDTVEGHIKSAFMTMVDGSASVEDAFRNMLRNIILAIYQQQVAKPAAESIGSWLSSAVTSFFGGPGMTTGTPLSVPASGDMSSLLPSANGNAFNRGLVNYFANGGVVDSITPFSYGGGTGVMGEAGPEAIMPLKRGKDGKLGVQAEGGGAVVVNNYFNMSANGDDSVKRIIRGEMPRITEATKAAVVDAKRRGGSYGRSF